MKNNFVSVIVPAFNAEVSIEKCLNSILGQTYKYIEVIVIDDGSFDNTYQLARNFESRNCIILRQNNSGVSSARNKGLSIARGEYICFVDSDDWIEPNMIQVMMNALNNYNYDLLACGVFLDYERNKKERSCYSSVCNDNTIIQNIDNPYREVICNDEIAGYLCNKIFKKALIKKKLDENIKQNEDLLFVVQYLRNVRTMGFIKSKFYHYNQSNDILSNKLTSRLLSLPVAYEKIYMEYCLFCKDLSWIPRRNLLKVYLNIRAKYRINKIEDYSIHNLYVTGIKKYLQPVLFDNHVRMVDKINIILTFIFPVSLLFLKQLILNRKIGE